MHHVEESTPSLREWSELFDEFGSLGEKLYSPRRDVEGYSDDPKLVGTILFHRIWGHFRSFALLWREGLFLDADVVLRNCCEAAICIANLNIRREDFVADLRNDAAHTLKGQMKVWRSIDGAGDLVRNGERHLQEIFRVGSEQKPFKKLQLEELAKSAGVTPLYSFYKSSSGMTAHVSGLSLLFHVAGDGSEADLVAHRARKMKAREQALAHMCVVMGVATLAYATLLELGELEEAKRLSLKGGSIGRRYAEDEISPAG